MGRQSKLKKLRKSLKDQPLVQELAENLEFLEKELALFNVSLTGENAQSVFEAMTSIERPENMTDEQFEAFLDEKMSNFIKNNLK
jgi:parvulin-like peptidyl-prolyl isomerase